MSFGQIILWIILLVFLIIMACILLTYLEYYIKQKRMGKIVRNHDIYVKCKVIKTKRRSQK